MSNSLRATGREVRGILADMSIAEVHPKTLEKPAPDTGNRMRLMHSVHLALYQAGRLANRGLERKTPKWPVRPEAISVLGYGAEKVVYRISGGEGQTDTVLSVYHRESLVSEPTIVINNKKEKHETYKT
ncbi:MAG TPA: hypothetical protein VJC09_02945 [Candidatus Saccharimonadales bacterium]|nr:hypothetical protein [Candidatus Saccharimonadales bacterium]